jgi:Spy/CpxP family protein refolding chaperone
MRFLNAALLVTLACATPLAVHAQTSPYAGMEHADIKALSSEELSTLLEGKGMGFAKAAELNGYPGPAHVLALSAELELSPQQIERTQALFERMQKDARADGAALIEAERALDRLYASRTATVAKVNGHLARIETTRAHLRGVHLNAHLEQTRLLNPAQIARYNELRGYSTGHHGH